MEAPNVLLVEDERIIALDMKRILEGYGYRVSGISSTGEDAVRRALETHPSLALMDIHLEGRMDGIEAARRIHETQNTPVVFLTAYADEATLQRAQAASPYGYLMKPCEPRELRATIQVAMARADADRKIEQANADLEKRVIERTAALEDALQELEAFSFSISHDLRAPLRAMAGISGLLKADHATELTTKARERLDQIDRNAHRMSDLIDGLLDLARFGRQALHRSQVDMPKLLAEAIAELAAPPGTRVEILGDPPPEAVCDRVLMRQVWINLLANAVKFSRHRDSPLVQAGYDAAQQAYFVRDNGAGFDMRYADKLFKVFSRLHSESEFEGTGIGLAIVERIVRRHGGALRAESQSGAGAAFFFTLPQ